MKKKFLKIISTLSIGSILLTSCGPKDQPPLVYFPDMYFPVAYDPLEKADIAYSDHETEIPLFVANDGATGLGPVTGTVSQNTDNIVEANNDLPLTPDQYNGGYDVSKTLTVSPLNPTNKAKDLARGKKLFEETCAACHGIKGDGQGPIVESGAYSGVPKYADREITVGSVHYVLTHGRNAMGSYAGLLNQGDRWRVAMYVMDAFKSSPTTTVSSASTETTATPATEMTPTTKK
ncbi:c-type cytochrome [Halpernia sp.]|uniref:c-type cytochrome n=1 Tax=Halpernia sp. TaxID=2782209 RepID=UPI003A938DFB